MIRLFKYLGKKSVSFYISSEMDRIPEIVFILLLIFASTLARRDDIEECGMDDYEHPSYEAMIDFLKVTGPLHTVILNALNHSLGAWQSSCTLVLKEAKEVRKNYMKDLECTSKKELRDHSFMEIDEFIAILKYWCNGMDQEQKDVFFNLNTLQCLNDIKKKFDNCIGYYSTRQKVQNRDYCK